MAAKKEQRRPSHHIGGHGSEYVGKKLTAPLPPEIAKKYGNKAKKK